MRVVVDANVVVSGLLIDDGWPAEVLRRWKAGLFELITSEPLMAELNDVLSRPRIVRRFLHPELGLEFLRLLQETAIVVEPGRSLAVVPTDPDDNRVVEAAVEGRADLIVSGDDDLLSLSEFEGIAIVTPARFVSMVTHPN